MRAGHIQYQRTNKASRHTAALLQQQQAQTDFTIEQIGQQKDQAKKDYIKDQTGSYVDYQKAINPYGANAEKMASMGMTKSGYSESSLVAIHNQYQNRVAAARESYTRALLEYDNAIKEARLQNSSILAEIAYQALQQQLELALQGFQYKNTLVLEKAKEKRQIKNDYYTRWKGVLDQINTENALAEQQRQFDKKMQFEREQFNWQKEQANKSSGAINKSSSSSGSKKTSKDGSFTFEDTGIIDISSGSNAQIDMASVLGLGYGPISEAKLAVLVNNGRVIEYQEDGKIKFKNNPKFQALTNIDQQNAYAQQVQNFYG